MEKKFRKLGTSRGFHKFRIFLLDFLLDYGACSSPVLWWRLTIGISSS